MVPYKAPRFGESSFNCPHCHAYSEQKTSNTVNMVIRTGSHHVTMAVSGIDLTCCTFCKKAACWVDKQLIYPSFLTASFPAADMPDDVLRDYEEARAVFDVSPRASAALLRLALQRLCVHLGQPGKEINADIKALVAAGLSLKLQKALDIIRVTGNEAVHPGTIRFDDDAASARSLFGILNMIVEEMITKPKEIDALYAGFPPDKIKGIEARDNKPGGAKE